MEIHHLNPEEVIAKNIMKYAGPMMYPFNLTTAPPIQHIEETSRGSLEFNNSENDKSENDEQEDFEYSSVSVKQEMQIEDTELDISTKSEETNLFEFVGSELKTSELNANVQTARIITAELQPPPLLHSKTSPRRKRVEENEENDAEMRKEIFQLQAEYIKLKIDRRRERYMQKVRREEEIHLKKLALLEAKADYYKKKVLRSKK